MGMVLLFVSALSAFSQNRSNITVTGTVVDDLNTPVEQATIQMLSLPDSTYVKGIATKGDGSFSLPRVRAGKYVLKVCRGTSCHVRRSDTVLQAIYNVTGMGEYKTSTDDGLFSIEVVSCLGACSLSPVVMVNDEVHPAMTPDKAMRLIAEIRTKEGVK